MESWRLCSRRSETWMHTGGLDSILMLSRASQVEQRRAELSSSRSRHCNEQISDANTHTHVPVGALAMCDLSQRPRLISPGWEIA